MRRLLPALLLLAAIFTACQRDAKTYKSAAAKAVNGHARMVAILDSIARNSDPASCYNLNSKMADRIKQQLDQITDPNQKVVGQFHYAEQLLYAGKNEAAIVQLTELTNLLGGQMPPGVKPIYELLALAYLRLGEQQNCIANHNAESCILPLQGGGLYTMKSGPENAVGWYEKILKAYPNDLDSRWLLNIAYMTLGKYPAGVPKQYLIPPSVFQKKGDLHFRDIAIPLGLDVRGISGSVCMEDFDNDGDLDLFMTSYGLDNPCRYFRNNGDGTFTERTHEANLDGIVSGLNCIHADYDNDGDRDLFILRGGWLDGGDHPNSLLRNNGDGTFTDVTIEAGLLDFNPTQAASWADYDGDGFLDLYIANESKRNGAPHNNLLYHNNGDGTFTNLAPQLHLNLLGFYKAAVWGDVNNDQRPDLYLSALTGENKLFLNKGGSAPDKWEFEDISAKAGVTNPLRSFPAWFFDYDNDGYDDILVCGYVLETDGTALPQYINEMLGKPTATDVLRLYHNNHDLTFTDVHQQMGLHKVNFAMGCNFGDLDNDGWPDFYLGTGLPDLKGLIPNRMFRNVEGQRFEELTMNGFGNIQKGHGVAFGDLDNDGDQDIYEVMGGAFEGDLSNNVLYENPGNSNHWVTIMLEGKTCNRDAIGAKIAVHTLEKSGKKRSIYADVNTGASFGSSSLRQEIGLGKAEKIESVEVWWPKTGIAKSVFTNVPLDSAVKLTEGKTEAEVVPLKKISFPPAS